MADVSRSDAPPTVSGGPPRAPSSWPDVIGWIAVVVGGLGAAGYGCLGTAGNVAFVHVMSELHKEGKLDEVNAAVLDSLHRHLPLTVGTSAASAALAVLLLIGGLGLIRRRSWSRGALVWWAVIRIVQAVPGSVVGYYINQAQVDAIEQMASGGSGGSGPPAALVSVMRTFSIGGLGCGVLIAWALPAFVLVWFARRAVRQEIAGWGRPEDSP